VPSSSEKSGLLDMSPLRKGACGSESDGATVWDVVGRDEFIGDVGVSSATR
jgi:hypothetical protein